MSVVRQRQQTQIKNPKNTTSLKPTLTFISQNAINSFHTCDVIVAEQPKGGFSGPVCALALRACKLSAFMFDSDIFACLETCFCASRQIFPDVLKKGTCQDKKRGRDGLWERERRGDERRDQFRSDETSWRISMWGLDWTYTCWSAAAFSGWKKRNNIVSREVGRESGPPRCTRNLSSCRWHHHRPHHRPEVRVLKHHPWRGTDLVSLPR